VVAALDLGWDVFHVWVRLGWRRLTRLEDDRLQSLLDELQVMKNARQQ
jgi:hypothetical protein